MGFLHSQADGKTFREDCIARAVDRIFKKSLGEQLASHYMIKGEAGGTYRINLDRDFLQIKDERVKAFLEEVWE